MLYKRLFIILHLVSGIYAGCCLSIAVIDQGFIKSINDMIEAKKLFAVMLLQMAKLMLPQLMLISVLTLVFSLRALKLKRTIKTYLPLFITTFILLVTGLCHMPINQAFVLDKLSGNEVNSNITIWYNWHWIRTILALVLPGLIVKYYRPLSLIRSTYTK